MDTNTHRVHLNTVQLQNPTNIQSNSTDLFSNNNATGRFTGNDKLPNAYNSQ
jgi:hypothetical protein